MRAETSGALGCYWRRDVWTLARLRREPARIWSLQRRLPNGSRVIFYRATVEGVSSVDVRLNVLPAADGEPPIECHGDDIAVNVPGAANAEDVGDILRAFGALIGIKGGVRIIIEPWRTHE
jgi:hypothetical protein